MLIEANRLGDMVAELIELSRLQGAERLHNVTDVDVDTIVSEAISRHKVAADNAEIEVRTDSSSGLHVLGTRPCW
ncbi:signal-transduction histidine kinase senX3 domain protein [Mycobacterium ulcerans str. Harvey]|uniref:Signal-transduction histidine kinase senX3 domain protein n=1 Tax=Mycobacterium ulcerans str. Harvey TaxID=1299332 RepID=A0ABN0QN92_MYCUL|nr:signal-transduction histidine kinase senX3 domain protein [Mycobacterium ulcerans str. Harvey]